MITKLDFTEEELVHFNYVLTMFQKLRNTAIDDIVSDELCEDGYCEIIVEHLENFRSVIDSTIKRNIE